MSEVRELSPGIFLEGEKLFLCPACGLKLWGHNPMDRINVFCWLLATLAVLQQKGVQGADPGKASDMADEWIAGGHRTHKEGGCNVEAN